MNKTKVILIGIGGLLLVLTSIALIFLTAIRGEFKEYLGNKYPNHTFHVGFTKIDPIYGKFYANATCLDDETAFPISKSWNTKIIYEDYLQYKSVIKYNSQIEGVFNGSDIRIYLKRITGLSKLDDGVYTQINITLTDDAEPIVVTKKVLDILKQKNISAERVIVSYERDKNVCEIHLASGDFGLDEDGLRAKVYKVKDYFGPGMADYSYYLTGDYRLVHAGTSVIWKDHEQTKVIDSNVVGIAWNNAFILAKQATGNSEHYWIIDVDGEKKYGPFSETDFENKKRELNIENELKLENPDQHRNLEKIQIQQRNEAIKFYNETDSKEVGNSSGNLINSGMAASKKGWIYFSNSSDKGKLYKVKMDGTGRVKISDDRVHDINVVDDWIYYINESDEWKIYRISTDGSKKQKLTHDRTLSNMVVVGNWMYFSNGSIHKVSTDGKVVIKLVNGNGNFLNVVGDWIYYSNSILDNELYRLKIDGSSAIKISDDKCAWINVSGDWVYYSNVSDEGKLYKVKTDGSEKLKLSDYPIALLNVNEDWAYYQGYSNKVYTLEKLKLDGSANKMVFKKEFAISLNVVDDWVYYSYYLNDKYENGAVMYRIKANGTREEMVR